MATHDAGAISACLVALTRVQGFYMKKPAVTMLYPGVVLRSSGMVIIPHVPKAKTSTVRFPIVAKSVVKARCATSSKRK